MRSRAPATSRREPLATRGPGSPPASNTSTRSEHLAGALTGITLLVYAAATIRTAWLSDDAYITLRTVDNWLSGFGMRWNVVERVQVYTHPLWMMLLSAVSFLTHEYFYSTLWVSIIFSLAAVAGVVAAARGVPHAALLSVVLLTCSRAFVDYSTSGLENALAHLLLALSVLALVNLESPGSLSWAALGAGLVVLTRPDLALLLGPALAWRWLTIPRTERSFMPLAIGALPPLCWSAFSLVYYGFLFPNTAYAKLGSGIPEAALLQQGLRYFVNSLLHDPLTLAGVGLGLWIALRSRERTSWGLALGIVFYLLYVLWIGGDFMSGRFFTAPLLLAAMITARGTADWSQRAAVMTAATWTVLAIVVQFTPLTGPRDPRALAAVVVDRAGIADERTYYKRYASLWDAGQEPAPHGLGVVVGQKAKQGQFPILIEGAVGFAGFFAGPTVHIVDFHALTEPLLARLPAVYNDEAHVGFIRKYSGQDPITPWRIGHFRRTIPAGYLAALLGNPEAITDPGLREYVARLQVVTRGELFSRARLWEILRFALGLNDALLARTRTTVWTPPHWEEVVARYPTYGHARFEYGVALWRANRQAQALAQFEQSLTINPHDAPSAYNAAILVEQRGDAQRAEALYRQSIESDPTFIDPLINLSHLLNQLGRHDEAYEIAERALKLAPNDPDARFNRDQATAARAVR